MGQDNPRKRLPRSPSADPGPFGLCHQGAVNLDGELATLFVPAPPHPPRPGMAASGWLNPAGPPPPRHRHRHRDRGGQRWGSSARRWKGAWCFPTSYPFHLNLLFRTESHQPLPQGQAWVSSWALRLPSDRVGLRTGRPRGWAQSFPKPDRSSMPRLFCKKELRQRSPSPTPTQGNPRHPGQSQPLPKLSTSPKRVRG